MIFSWNVSKHMWNLQSSVKASLASTKKKKKKKKKVCVCVCVGEFGGFAFINQRLTNTK